MDIKLNQDESTIQVDLKGVTIARGTWVVDTSGKTMLVHFHELNLLSSTTVVDEDEELRKFFDSVALFYSKIYITKIFYYVPMLCTRKMIASKSKTIMAIEKKNLKQLPKNVSFDHRSYAIVTDKKEIHLYLQSLVEMARTNAFWLTKCDENEMKARLDSSSRNLMVLYKDDNNEISLPVGFVRLLTTRDQKLTYLSDVIITASHQSKGLASYMLDRLFEMFLGDEDSSSEKEGLVCLECASRGSGMHSAPKLYKKFGFEFLTECEKNVPLFLNEDYVVWTD